MDGSRMMGLEGALFGGDDVGVRVWLCSLARAAVRTFRY